MLKNVLNIFLLMFGILAFSQSSQAFVAQSQGSAFSYSNYSAGSGVRDVASVSSDNDKASEKNSSGGSKLIRRNNQSKAVKASPAKEDTTKKSAAIEIDLDSAYSAFQNIDIGDSIIIITDEAEKIRWDYEADNEFVFVGRTHNNGRLNLHFKAQNNGVGRITLKKNNISRRTPVVKKTIRITFTVRP